MPTGLTLTSLGLVRGVPVEAGEFTFRVRVVDDRGEAAESEFTMTMVDPLVVDTSVLPAGTVGDRFAADLVASGGTAPYAWTVVADPSDGDAVPAGLGLSADGLLSGVPERSGDTRVTVEVVDAEGRSARRTWPVAVVDPLVIRTALLPLATTGTAYEFAMEGSGGRAPLAWRVSSGVLPPGLELSADGQVAGVPSVATTTEFVVRVVDADGRVAAFRYSMVVATGTVRQTVVARGGSVVVDIVDDRVVFVSAAVAPDFMEYVIHRGPDRVQVHFIGPVGTTPSWVLCEGSPDATCSFD